MEWILAHAADLRAPSFFGLLIVLAIWERLAPRRQRVERTLPRTALNLALLGSNALAARLVVPAGVVGAGLWAQSQGLGLLTISSPPVFVALPLAFILLDLGIYAQHVAFHRVPLLWRIHRLHHRDRDLDASSAGRFHPLEILTSLAWKSAVVIGLGAPPVAVVIYEIALGLCAIWTHANLGLPQGGETALRMVLVTPDVHRVHHSIEVDESNANFGTITTLWDRLFGTFRPESRGDQRTLVLGAKD